MPENRAEGAGDGHGKGRGHGPGGNGPGGPGNGHGHGGDHGHRQPGQPGNPGNGTGSPGNGQGGHGGSHHSGGGPVSGAAVNGNGNSAGHSHHGGHGNGKVAGSWRELNAVAGKFDAAAKQVAQAIEKIMAVGYVDTGVNSPDSGDRATAKQLNDCINSLKDEIVVRLGQVGELCQANAKVCHTESVNFQILDHAAACKPPPGGWVAPHQKPPARNPATHTPG